MSNLTQSKSRLLALAQLITEEAQRWPRGQTRTQLTRASLQLASVARSVDTFEQPVIEAYLVECITFVSKVATARAFKESPWLS